MNANNQYSWSQETELYIILHVLYIGIPVFYMQDMRVLHTRHACSTYLHNSDIHSVLHSSVKCVFTQVIQWQYTRNVHQCKIM